MVDCWTDRRMLTTPKAPQSSLCGPCRQRGEKDAHPLSHGLPRSRLKFCHSLPDMADHQTSPNVAARKSRPKKKKVPSQDPLVDEEMDMETAIPPPRARSYVLPTSALVSCTYALALPISNHPPS